MLASCIFRLYLPSVTFGGMVRFISLLNMRLLRVCVCHCIYVVSFTVIERRGRSEPEVCSGNGFARCVLLKSGR